MRPKSLVLLALALGCGLIASIGISQVLDSKGKPAKVETLPIYVALHNLNLNDPIDDTMVSLEEWPKDKIPVGAIDKWEDVEDRRPRATIFKGEPLLDSKLLAKGQINDPIKAIPPGMRLKTISVDARRSAAGLVGPGNRVDLQIYVRRNPREGFSEPFSKIFLQNIRVFAVDATVERSADGDEARTIAKTISLIVTPEQANRINLAENLGDISLIPRSDDDEKIVEEFELNPDELLSRGFGNNRDKERGAPVRNPNPAPINLPSILSTIAPKPSSAPVAAPVEKPFEMTIIYPSEVARVQFADGQPVMMGPPTDAGSPVQSLTSSGPAPVEQPADSASDDSTAAEPPPADFPIDLRFK